MKNAGWVHAGNSGLSLDSRGVTYLTVMFAIVLIGITLAAVGKHWKMIVQREKEADFLAKGIEIQNALALYSATMKVDVSFPARCILNLLSELHTASQTVFASNVSGSDNGWG